MTDALNPQAGYYPATHWTLIYKARELEQTTGRMALGSLLQVYRGSLLQHLTWKFRSTPEQAEDWLHGFIEKKVLEYQLMQHAERERGRFRSFLLSALDRFVFDELDRDHAQKRNPEEGFVPMDEARDVPVGGKTDGECDPGDVEWAKDVLAQAVDRTKKWYHSQGSEVTWAVFAMGRVQPLLEGGERPSDQQIAMKCGLPVEKVSNTLNNATRKFRTELRTVIREYAADDTEVEQELRALISLLGKAV